MNTLQILPTHLYHDCDVAATPPCYYSYAILPFFHVNCCCPSKKNFPKRTNKVYLILSESTSRVMNPQNIAIFQDSLIDPCRGLIEEISLVRH